MQFLATKPPPADYVEQNMEAVRGEAHSPETLLEFGNDVHNYSTQFLNYGDMQVWDPWVACDIPFPYIHFQTYG